MKTLNPKFSEYALLIIIRLTVSGALALALQWWGITVI